MDLFLVFSCHQWMNGEYWCVFVIWISLCGWCPLLFSPSSNISPPCLLNVFSPVDSWRSPSGHWCLQWWVHLVERTHLQLWDHFTGEHPQIPPLVKTSINARGRVSMWPISQCIINDLIHFQQWYDMILALKRCGATGNCNVHGQADFSAKRSILIPLQFWYWL